MALNSPGHGKLMDEAAAAENVGRRRSSPRELLCRRIFEARWLGDDDAWRFGVQAVERAGGRGWQ